MTTIKGEKVVPKPLNKHQRDMAQVLIDREHPLQDLLIWDTLPCLRKCKRRLPDFIPYQTAGDQSSTSSDDEATTTNADPFERAISLVDSSSQLITDEKEVSGPTGKKFCQMEKYQEVTRQALKDYGDDLTYSTLIEKLDQAYVEEK